MGKDCNKKKKGCGKTQHYAKCTLYGGEIPEWSDLHEEEKCVSLEDTTEDIYEQITLLKEEFDFSDVTSCCIEIENDPETGSPTPKTVTEALVLTAGELACKDDCAAKCDIDITGYGLNYRCLTAPCDEEITRLSQLLQAVIDLLCGTDE